MKERIIQHTHSFRYAWEGLKHAWLYEPNFSIHIILSLAALVLGVFLHITSTEFLMVLLVITLGLATELANTAIESVTDLVTKEHRLEAKIAKDVAAGMMLVVAIGAVFIGLTIYIPYIIRLFNIV